MTELLLTFLGTRWPLDPAGYLGLAAVVLIGSLVPVPRTPLSIASGFVFGLSAVPVVSVASTAGGMIAFVVARYLLQDKVRRLLGRRRLSSAVLRAVDLEGWRIVALMRLYGPLPATVQNYAFGLTSIGFWTFSVATLVFSAPQIVFYCYLGSLGQRALEGDLWGSMSYVTLAMAAVCFGTVIILVGRRVRSLLRNADASRINA